MLELLNVAAKATEATQSADAISIAMAVMTVIGAAFLFGFSLPLFFTTIRTRDTSQINYTMWSIYIVATFFLGVPSLVNSITVLSGNTTELDKVNMIPLLIIGIANIVSLLTAVTMVVLKAINRANAKKDGLTEIEYCMLHNPVLKKQNKLLSEENKEELDDNIEEVIVFEDNQNDNDEGY